MSDILVMALKNAGSSIFAASFIAKIGNNLLDKVGTCVLAYFLIKSLPVSMRSSAQELR